MNPPNRKGPVSELTASFWSFTAVLVKILQKAPGKKMNLCAIFRSIEKDFPNLTRGRKFWKGFVRRNLALSRFFVKVNHSNHLRWHAWALNPLIEFPQPLPEPTVPSSSIRPSTVAPSEPVFVRSESASRNSVSSSTPSLPSSPLSADAPRQSSQRLIKSIPKPTLSSPPTTTSCTLTYWKHPMKSRCRVTESASYRQTPMHGTFPKPCTSLKMFTPYTMAPIATTYATSSATKPSGPLIDPYWAAPGPSRPRGAPRYTGGSVASFPMPHCATCECFGTNNSSLNYDFGSGDFL